MVSNRHTKEKCNAAHFNRTVSLAVLEANLYAINAIKFFRDG